MNAYNPLITVERLEGAGFERAQAIALATELQSANEEHVTKEDLFKTAATLKADLTATAWTIAGVATGVILGGLGLVVTVILSH